MTLPSGSRTAGHRVGDPQFRRISVALFAAGLATFALLYTPQPLLPELSAAFGVSAWQATLSVSVCTLGLGAALLVVGPVSEPMGRTPLMHASLLASSAVGVACALSPGWTALLVLRAVQGVTLAGLPAVAMTYLREEVAEESHARATGLYVGGTALGGMAGRLLSGGLADLGGWRAATAGVGVLGVACAFTVLWLLPSSRRFRPAHPSLRSLARTTRGVLSDPALLAPTGSPPYSWAASLPSTTAPPSGSPPRRTRSASG